MAQHIDLVLSLDLVIALDGLGVGRGRVGGGPVAAALAGVIRRRRAAARVRGAVVCVSALEGLLARVVWLVRLLLLLSAGGWMGVRRRLYEDVGHAAALPAVAVRESALVLVVVVVGEVRDDVPCVDETRELVDMMETARNYQNNVEVMQTAKQLIVDTLKLGR